MSLVSSILEAQSLSSILVWLIDWLIETNKIKTVGIYWLIPQMPPPHHLNVVNNENIHLNKSLKLLIDVLFFKKTPMPGK